MKHGMYSTVARQTLGEIIERERRKMGVAWSDVEELVARLWGTVESHVEDEEILEEVAEDWKQTYDAWDFSGPRQYYL